MQPTTPHSLYDTDPQPRHELLSGTPEAERLVVQAQEYVNNAYDHERREERQAGVARAAIDQRGLHNSTPENVNPTPAEWVAMVGKAIEGIRRKEMDHTIMYGDTSITTSSAEKPVNNSFPLPPQDTPRYGDEADLVSVR